MNTITSYLTQDHSHCDNLFAELENAVFASDWTKADTQFAEFTRDTLRHFAREEDVLFPAFEARTGIVGGPTQVMHDEHDQMRNILDGMATSLAIRDADGFLGLSETLLMLMRQHNMKEERILYPMADQALDTAPELVQRMADIIIRL